MLGILLEAAKGYVEQGKVAPDKALKSVIELMIYIGDMQRRRMIEDGHKHEIIDAVMCETPYSKEYWINNGIQFDKSGNVI
jgi:hypothetical protein